MIGNAYSNFELVNPKEIIVFQVKEKNIRSSGDIPHSGRRDIFRQALESDDTQALFYCTATKPVRPCVLHLPAGSADLAPLA